VSDAITNYPLTWPIRRPRTRNRKRAAFRSRGSARLTIADACARLLRELRRLGVRQAIVSSNAPPTSTGLPRSSSSEPADPGAAVYFERAGRPYCLACDRWDRVADNIAAIAAEIEANRGRERWGVVTLDEAFEAFVARLPATTQWWQKLGLAHPDVTPDHLRKVFRELARQHHPDLGGDAAKMSEYTAAYEEGLEALAKRGTA
jgi:hypothetical protein